MGRILTILALVALVRGQEEICLSGEEEPYLMFGTKTAYTFVNTGSRNNPREHEVLGCNPVAFWSLNRHGSTNPEADELTELQRLTDLKNNIISNYRNSNFRNTNHRICTSDINLLDRWVWNTRQNMTFAGDLTSDGYITTQQLAQAWRQKYPALLTDNRHDYLFKYVNDQVLGTTFQAFTEGLFRAQAEGYGIPKENDEQKLRPYKFCPAWKKEVEDNNETLSQLRIFESKQEYREMITNISLRLGFNYDVDAPAIKKMYNMCRYNKAWDVAQISPWCAVFTKEDLKRLEYAEDLETYYKYGYGSPINQKVGCTLIKDMMDFFKTQVEHGEVPQQPRTIIHFTDAPMILLTQTALGARRGATPLTGDNYRTQMQQRKWQSSVMSPFDANLAAVLYKCNPNSNYQVQEKYQVLFLENEHQMYLDGCRVGLCDWTMVQQKYGNVADNCDLKFCNAATSFKGFLGLSLALISFLVKYISG